MPNELAGVKELSIQLGELGKRAGHKALRSAVFKATTPVVREMKALAPRGTRAHKSHKGRILVPGFLSRSVRRKSRVGRGKAAVSIGVRSEAYYGVSFLDEGVTVESRKRKGGASRKITGGESRAAGAIRPYTIPGKRWFKPVFRRNKDKMIGSFRELLRDAIKKAKAKK